MIPFQHRIFSEPSLMLEESANFMALPFDSQAAEHPGMANLKKQCAAKMETTSDGIAIIPVQGVLAKNPHAIEMAFYGVEDSDAIRNMITDAANNPQIQGILLNVDSPGGFVTGGPEVADAVKEAGKTKPCMAFIGGTGASLAYWIASQASAVIASRSARVGSIGCYSVYADTTAANAAQGVKLEVIKNKEGTYKAAGVNGISLTDEQRANLQASTQGIFNAFAKDVQSMRPGVTADSMRGQVFTGAEAKKAGLVDAVGTMSYAMAALKKEVRKCAQGVRSTYGETNASSQNNFMPEKIADQTDILAINEQLTADNAAMTAQVATLTGEKATLATENATLKTTLATAEDSVKTLTSERDTLKATSETQAAAIDAAHENATNLEVKMADFNKSVADKVAAIGITPSAAQHPQEPVTDTGKKMTFTERLQAAKAAVTGAK